MPQLFMCNISKHSLMTIKKIIKNLYITFIQKKKKNVLNMTFQSEANKSSLNSKADLFELSGIENTNHK